MELIIAHKVEILALLLAISECLAISKKIEANSIFQLVFSMIKKAAGK
jgi:hypothetical protein